jgi:voltage-gated potassium channel
MVEVLIAVLAVFSIVLICVEYVVALPPAQLNMIYMADLLVCLAFAADFAYRTVKAEDRRVFLKTYWFEVLAMLPAYLFGLLETEIIFGAMARSLRTIRVLRVLRVIALAARLRRFTHVASSIIQRSRLIYLFTYSLAIIFIGALGAYMVESKVADSPIKSIGDAVWWSFATVTTVGYGDIVPASMEGRILGVILMFAGIAFIGVFISTLGATLTERRFKATEAKTITDETTEIIKNKIDQLGQLSTEELKTLIKMIEALHEARKTVATSPI